MLARLRQAQLDDVVVVLGAHGVDADARGARCLEWERGPGASLRCGLRALGNDVAAAVVVLADGPDLSPAAVDRIVAAWRSGAGDVVAASYGGARSHPVLLARAVWARVPDEGARALEAALVPCDDLGEPGDVDVPEDLRNADCALCCPVLQTPVVHESASWRTAINRNQNLLGKLIVVLRRHEEDVTALTHEE